MYVHRPYFIHFNCDWCCQYCEKFNNIACSFLKTADRMKNVEES